MKAIRLLLEDSLKKVANLAGVPEFISARGGDAADVKVSLRSSVGIARKVRIICGHP